ncbi:MAG: SDR family NAD(P)-dependent oxidoreductase [Acidimicrobiia bacterium]
MQDLKGKVAVVTGGASGIGLAMAERFGTEGMSVVLADIEHGPLERAEARLSQQGVAVLAVPTDVTSFDDVTALAAATLGRFGAAHIVCNNAGVGPAGAIGEMSLEEYRWIVEVNFWGVLHGVKAFLPHLLAAGEGHFVNTASVAGLLTQPGMSAYNVSKFGVVALSESLYYELAMLGANVGVSVVCPAWVRTRIHESERNRPGTAPGASGPVTDRVREAADKLMGSSRRSPDDVASLVVDAVRNNTFYVLTHKGILPFLRQRHEDVEELRNPSVEQGF